MDTSDVGVAVVTASGWVATLGQGAVVLQATCNEASASVRIDVEEAARPTKRVDPPLPKTKAAQPPIPAPVEPTRPVRRRRTRRSWSALALHRFGNRCFVARDLALWRAGKSYYYQAYTVRRPVFGCRCLHASVWTTCPCHSQRGFSFGKDRPPATAATGSWGFTADAG